MILAFPKLEPGNNVHPSLVMSIPPTAIKSGPPSSTPPSVVVVGSDTIDVSGSSPPPSSTPPSVAVVGSDTIDVSG